MKTISKFTNSEIPLLAQLGKVIMAESGIAKVISCFNKTFAVYAQAAHLSALYPGDEILFFNTASGPYIVARTLRQNELPQVGFKHQHNQLSLNFGEAAISVSEDGEIKLEGKIIRQEAKGDIQINAGKYIYLNSP